MKNGRLFAIADVTTRLTRRNLLRWTGLAGGAAVATGLATTGRALEATPASTPVTSAGCGDGAVPGAITAVMQKPRYAKATWNLFAVDVASGETVLELDPDQKALTGSVRKLYSVGLALRQLGADHLFTTPVYRRGTVDTQGVLTGELVLVAAGDLTFGGRLTADGGIQVTDFDHNDANNLGTAILTPQDPLLALDRLAEQVRASGIQSVTGRIVVDDRLFERFRVPNQNLLITPIMVNENMVDVTITPAQAGEAAAVAWRPQTGAFTVWSDVMTTAAGTPDTVTLSGDAHVQCLGKDGCASTISGDIPVGYKAPLTGKNELVQTFRIEDPAAFARTAFIEALERAGVTVKAPAVAANSTDGLPDAYAPEDRVAAFVSPPYADYAKLILKVSLNLGANLSLMLFGLTHGQRTIGDALAVERQALIDEMGIKGDAFDFPTNGSGSPDSQATARATVQLLTEMSKSGVADIYKTALPILGVDGSLSTTGTSLPARGHVYGKTGTTLENGELKAQNLAGYIDTRSGRRLAYAIFINNAGPIRAITDVTDVFEDEAVITNALYESC